MITDLHYNKGLQGIHPLGQTTLPTNVTLNDRILGTINQSSTERPVEQAIEVFPKDQSGDLSGALINHQSTIQTMIPQQNRLLVATNHRVWEKHKSPT